MKIWASTGICLFLLLLQGCGSINVNKRTSSETLPETGRTFVFTCSDGLKFVARTTVDGKAWLFLSSATLNLQQAASGIYLSDGVMFKVEAEQAQLEEPGGNHLDCRNDRRQAIWEHAKLSGADFRAIGNEPGWNMEIRQQSRLILVTSYGSERFEFDLPEPKINQQARSTVYEIRQAGKEVILMISGEFCRDSMSGEEFSSKVDISINGKPLQGCGRALH